MCAAIQNVYCDESGNTGQNLSDLSQPAFTLASSIVEAAAALKALERFDRLNQKEVKYNKVRKTGAGQKLAVEFLRDPVVTGDTSKLHIIHKPFMIVTKIVDMIYEPQVREMGENFYHHKQALATANLLVTTCPVFAGRTWFYRVLERFVKAVRTKQPEDIERFFADAAAMRESTEEKHGKENADMLLPIELERVRNAPHIRTASPDELDPIVPAFMMHAGHWSGLSTERFKVISDASSTLERNHGVFLEFSDPRGTPVTSNYHGHKITFPLKIDSFRFADSQAEPSIRFVDLLAGITADALGPMANKEKPSPYQRQLAELVFEKKLVLDSIWPTSDVTPEALNATEGEDVNPADVTAEFLSSVRASKRIEP